MNSARLYYDIFHSLALPRLGPYLDVQKFTQDQVHQLQHLNETYGKIAQKEIEEHVKNFNNGEIFVPSPWHAWTLLTLLHSQITRVDNQKWNALDNFVVPAYRGHEDSNYQILPSLYRSNNQETEQRYLDIFTLIFNQPFLWQNLDISLPLESAKAAAQHYGIHTDLLDITADPATAIYFACRPNSKNHIETGAVLVFDLQNILSSNTRIIMPPPMVDRLYKQRGAFLAFPTNDFHSIRNLIKITFPPNPDFQILREGKQIDILETDHWFERAVNKSKEWIDQGNAYPIKHDEIDNFVRNIFKSIDYPAVLKNQDPMFILAHWIDQFEDMIYWFAMRIENNNEGALSSVCENIAQNNPNLIRLAIKIYDKDNQKMNLRNFWTKMLKNSKLE